MRRFRRTRAVIGGLAATLPAVLFIGACRPVPPAPVPPLDPAQLDGARVLREVAAFVALGPRVSGTPCASNAAHYIATRLKDAGVEARVDTFRDPTPEGAKLFRNVLGRLPGETNALVVLLSHYDTKAGISDTFAGANDSGSSTGLLLELARVLRRAPRRRHELLLAFVDGEECLRRYGDTDGLHGSRRLAAQLRRDGEASRVRAVIVLDMVGDSDLSVTLPRNGSPELLALALDCARREGIRDRFSLHDHAVLDDHVPFLLDGMPAVDIIDFQYGSAPGRNDYWHTPADAMDKLSAESLQAVGRVVIRMLNGL